MVDVHAIARQVLFNCSISDAHHAGLYSICGLALRLRHLYKWEKGLEPWVEEDSKRMLAWIGEREESWEAVAERAYEPITVQGESLDPFDVEGINAVLEPEGWFYGAGYVHSLKPTFLLAELESKRWLNGTPVYMLGRELARDLLTIPAMSQGDRVLVRTEAARAFLWDQIFFLKKSGRGALQSGLKVYGVGGTDLQSLHERFEDILTDEIENYIYHELGEIRDQDFDREIWRNIIATFPHSPIELLARSVKDVLADTNSSGKLQHIVRNRKTASLALYVAFLDGMRKEILPGFTDAFWEFEGRGDWGVIEAAIASGYRSAREYAETMSHIYCSGMEKGDMKWAGKEMKRQLLEPLGLGTA